MALFVFNRPDTTRKVFAEIRTARPSTLLVVADGPRASRAGEEEQCRAARAVIQTVDWPCEVLTNFAQTNLGCKKRISSGLDWVFSRAAEAVILEDDCVPHPSFFQFCEQLLERYRHDERVMMIGGTNYLQDRLKVEDSYVFSRYYAVWGWASWQRAWSRYDITMRHWPQFKKEGRLKAFYRQPFMRRVIASIFDAAHQERVDTWDIQWFYSCLFNNGLSIVPRANLISNIGTRGTHTGKDSTNNFFPVFPAETGDMRHPDLVCPDITYDDSFFAEQFRPRFSTLLRQGKTFVRTRWRGVARSR